jgi:signal transduction histidine kinase
MNLATFIETNLEQILEKWETSPRQGKHPSAVNNISIRRDDAGELLRAIARDLRARRQSGRRHGGEKRDRNEARADIQEAADKHGAGRARLGFTLDQMVAEFPLLRSSVIGLWLSEAPAMTADDVDDLVRFNESVDLALCQSVSEFVGRINRSRELFLGILGHDLRDPLSAIVMSADLLADLPPGEERREIAGRVHKIGTRMQQMIADLLDFTRTRFGGGMPIERQSVDLREVVQSAADEIKTSHPGRDVHVEASGDLQGSWDPRRIGQALANLLGNAVQHGPEETSVDVRARGDDVEVSLAVHNEGPPIPPERHAEIFDPLSAATEGGRHVKRDPNHLGLGLYIAREIVKSHHGKIDVESSADRGTTFTIHLPREGGDRA